MTWIKVGARNLARNRRRSCFTIGAVALGFLAVNMFGGYTAYVFTALEDGFVHLYANGHLSIFKRGFLVNGALRPYDYLLAESEVEQIRRICMADPRVVLVTPQLLVTGLVSNGSVSTIFAAQGRVPADVELMRLRAKSSMGRLKMYDGEPLTEEVPYGVGLSRGLSRKLDLGFGAEPIVLATTVDGQMNALDAEVRNVFDAHYDVLDDKLMEFPLGFARSLYDTGGADRLVVLLESGDQTVAAAAALEQALAASGAEVEVRPWEELCLFYVRVRDMFNVMFSFIFMIVFVIVVLSVVNTVSMAVVERTREIGTLRALGLKRRGVLVMFAAESGLLGLLGGAVGMVLTMAVWWALRVARLEWMPPVVPKRVPFEVYLVPEYLALSLAVLVLLAIAAAVVSARRAARMEIIDALGHV